MIAATSETVAALESLATASRTELSRALELVEALARGRREEIARSEALSDELARRAAGGEQREPF